MIHFAFDKECFFYLFRGGGVWDLKDFEVVQLGVEGSTEWGGMVVGEEPEGGFE
jgi:hypothetical protein